MSKIGPGFTKTEATLLKQIEVLTAENQELKGLVKEAVKSLKYPSPNWRRRERSGD